jgi:hypothetical protein
MPISNERGSAILMALLLALLVGAIAAALVTVTTTETLIGASYRHAQEASFGAEAALERALHDLSTVPDWSQVLAAPPSNLTSTFDDGQAVVSGPDGSTLDLARLTALRQRDSDARYGATTFGADTPQWRLYAHAAPRDLSSNASLDMPLYLVVWVADDESDGDGDASADSNRRILVWAAAFGAGGARKAVEARIARTATGELRVDGWRPAH